MDEDPKRTETSTGDGIAIAGMAIACAIFLHGCASAGSYPRISLDNEARIIGDAIETSAEIEACSEVNGRWRYGGCQYPD